MHHLKPYISKFPEEHAPRTPLKHIGAPIRDWLRQLWLRQLTHSTKNRPPPPIPRLSIPESTTD